MKWLENIGYSEKLSVIKTIANRKPILSNHAISRTLMHRYFNRRGRIESSLRRNTNCPKSLDIIKQKLEFQL